MKPEKIRKNWTPEEDKQVIELMKIHNRDWKSISNIMGDRTGKQIRERFINKLDPQIS